MLFLLEKNLEESKVIDLDSLYTVLPVSVCDEGGKLLITTASMFDASCIEKMELSLSSRGLFCKGIIADYGYMEGHAEHYTGLTPYEDMLQGISGKNTEVRKRTDEEIAVCVEELIEKMTLEEKIGQMEQSAGMDVSEIGMEIESKPMIDQIRDGEIGSLIHMGYAPETVYAYQKLASEKAGLGYRSWFVRMLSMDSRQLCPFHWRKAAHSMKNLCGRQPGRRQKKQPRQALTVLFLL